MYIIVNVVIRIVNVINRIVHVMKNIVNVMNSILYNNDACNCRFGKSHYDDLTILALKQCCLTRFSTLRRLLGFRRSQTTLAERMRQSMARDKLAPILTESHLRALDRRLRVVLEVIYNCTMKLKVRDVIVDDGF